MRAERDGSGQVRATVALDPAAAAVAPDLADQLRVEDLEAAGWRVEAPPPDKDGRRQLQAVKSFSSPEGAARAVEELAGPAGPFREFALAQDRSFFKTRTRLAGTVDLSGGLEAFIDPGLRQQLAGADVATIERQLGVTAAEAFRFEVEARLPGQARTWPVELGQLQEVRAAVEAWNTPRIVFLLLALASGLALVVVLVRRSRLVTWG